MWSSSCGVEHVMWNSQRTDHNRGTGGRAVRTHLSLGCHFDSRQQRPVFQTFLPFLFAKRRLGFRWPPVSPPCVLGWVAVGHPLARSRGSVTFFEDKGGREGRDPNPQ